MRTIRRRSSRSSLYCHAEWRCNCTFASAIIFYVWELRFLVIAMSSIFHYLIHAIGNTMVLNAPSTCQSENITRKLRKTWHVAHWIIVWNSDRKSPPSPLGPPENSSSNSSPSSTLPSGSDGCLLLWCTCRSGNYMWRKGSWVPFWGSNAPIILIARRVWCSRVARDLMGLLRFLYGDPRLKLGRRVNWARTSPISRYYMLDLFIYLFPKGQSLTYSHGSAIAVFQLFWGQNPRRSIFVWEFEAQFRAFLVPPL